MTAAGQLFDRDWSVTVGGTRIARPLRVAFDVTRSVRPTPNAATIRIWNLSRETRARIQDSAGAAVDLEAGYRGDTTAIFVGTVRRARGNQAPPLRAEHTSFEVVSVIEATDGGDAYAEARISAGYAPGVSVSTVLRDCARALGVGAGNLDEVLELARLEGGQTTYPGGTVLSGQASRELTRILASYGLRWSVQHGNVQVTRRGAALQTQAVRLSPSTGLLGWPELKSAGRLAVRALLSPSLWPGRRVVLESDLARGQYLVTSIRWAGDSHGNEWSAHLELRPEATA